jgi:hypothetical protein
MEPNIYLNKLTGASSREARDKSTGACSVLFLPAMSYNVHGRFTRAISQANAFFLA